MTRNNGLDILIRNRETALDILVDDFQQFNLLYSEDKEQDLKYFLDNESDKVIYYLKSFFIDRPSFKNEHYIDNLKLNRNNEISNEISIICDFFQLEDYIQYYWIIIFLYWLKNYASAAVLLQSPFDQINSFYEEFSHSNNGPNPLYDKLIDNFILYVDRVFCLNSSKKQFNSETKICEKDLTELIFIVLMLNAYVSCFLHKPGSIEPVSFDIDDSLFYCLNTYCSFNSDKFDTLKENILPE